MSEKRSPRTESLSAREPGEQLMITVAVTRDEGSAMTSAPSPRHLGARALGAKGEEAAAESERRVTQSEVLRAAAAGEPWAHAALYDALYPFVAAALQKILHQAPDYEDLVQTTFEQIVRSLRRPQPIENLAAWSSAIAARVALMSIRAKARERKVFARDVEPPEMKAPELERHLDARRELRWLQESLAAIPPEQAEAVLLHDVLGYDLAQVARTMDISMAAAQKRLSRGHIKLRRRAELRARGRAR